VLRILPLYLLLLVAMALTALWRPEQTGQGQWLLGGLAPGGPTACSCRISGTASPGSSPVIFSRQHGRWPWRSISISPGRGATGDLTRAPTIAGPQICG
jgi:hypothetical protein